jgi:uncharacterized protein (DUF1697 family)
VTVFVALLRGINVGGARKVPMKRLTPLFEAAGHTDVAAYIQSGNVVFASSRTQDGAIERDLEERVAEEFGFAVAVVVRSAKEMSAVLKNNPYLDHEPDFAKLGVTFLPVAPAKAALAAFDYDRYQPERALVRGREIFFHLPNGFGVAKLPDALARTIKIDGTMRNWNTVTKLYDMMSTIS